MSTSSKPRRLPIVVPPNTATPEELARALLRPVKRREADAPPPEKDGALHKS